MSTQHDSVFPSTDVRTDKTNVPEQTGPDVAKRQPPRDSNPDKEDKYLPEKKTKPNEPTPSDVDILASLCGLTLSPILRRDISKFVPNSRMFYYIIQEMDRIMISTKSWQPYCVVWNPLLSRVYFGICFILQTMRCMRYCGIATQEILDILENIETTIGWSKLTLPGPMATMFKSISVTHSDHVEVGIVTPYLPNVPGADQRTHHAYSSNIRPLLPNLNGLYRAYAHVQLPDPANPNSTRVWDFDLGDPAALVATPRGVAAGVNIQARDARIMPGTKFIPPFTPRQWNAWRTSGQVIPLPNPPANHAGMTWTDVLGISRTTHWFGRVASEMAIYSKHWHGSSNMNNISVLNGEAPLVTTISQYQYPSLVYSRNVDNIMDYSVKATSKNGTLPTIPSELGMLSQINWIPSTNFSPDPHIGTSNVGGTRFGPVWQNMIDRMASIEFDPTPSISEILSSRYHTSRPKD